MIDNLYRDTVGLAIYLNVYNKLQREPSDREASGNPYPCIPICLSRIRDDMNFYYVCGRHTAQPSPWTVPEIRAYHDYMTRVDDWLVDNSELELNDNDMPITKRGENLDELITEARFERVLRLELH